MKGFSEKAAGDGAHSGAASPAALRQSASERVPRDPSHFRFVDPAFFERPASPLPPLMERPSPEAASAPASEAAMRRAPDAGCPRAFQRRSRFDAHEVFPEPAKRADPAAAGAHGEIALYGEIERRLRKRGIAEPARDLETLKQILEALQLNGLLHHAPTPPPVCTAPAPPPPIVMRPNHRAQPPARLTPVRRLRVDVDRARRPRSHDPSASLARSPASPARRGPRSSQQRVSPVHSPKQQQPPFRRPSGFDSAGAHGEITLYGEIERRLRKRGIAEPARDLETLKQIREALQLKGLLHHTPTLLPSVRTALAPLPPIVWAEVRCAGVPAPRTAEDEVDEEAEEDLNAVTCRAIRRDMAADEGRWAAPRQRWVSGAEAAEAVLQILQIQRMVFWDLVADTIRELADAGLALPRQRLVF